ncbi:DUF3182 family protein [Starkeya koreensis]|uniref:DUF3182 family protein n=1 Tax=Ancylobacter koreensis TaxID=266121 RepID=A0ABT0DKY2_9HYPH|nr:DUF3182 family protein [Ancylobacter koreensis]MCK0207941.1 DUF3182 family protein [Ancylobacter koreensis]
MGYEATLGRGPAQVRGPVPALDVAEGSPAPVLAPVTGGLSAHRIASVRALARRIAALRGSALIDPPPNALRTRCYVVPGETLVGPDEAQRYGIRDEDDLFGGVVPHAVLAGKAITHALVDPQAPRPEGWVEDFGAAVRSAVPRGWSCFDLASARRAAELLLADGPVRLKAAWADGGHGQSIVDNAAALEAALGLFDAPDLACCGLVVEENLSEATTYSIGRVRIGRQVLSYVGEQFTTTDNDGASAYGGSTLTVVRGELDALAALDLDAPRRAAVEAASLYDRAALAHVPGLVASRRNYDVIGGRDARDEFRIGVLEQSWRIGGASGAEIAAFEAFAANPELAVVRASCVERYGAEHEPPRDALVYFDADDAEVGPLLKYARIEARSLRGTDSRKSSRAF